MQSTMGTMSMCVTSNLLRLVLPIMFVRSSRRFSLFRLSSGDISGDSCGQSGRPEERESPLRGPTRWRPGPRRCPVPGPPLFLAECPARLSNVVTMPLTVPRRPRSGAAAIIEPNTTRCWRNDSPISSRARRSSGSCPSPGGAITSRWRRDLLRVRSSLKHLE